MANNFCFEVKKTKHFTNCILILNEFWTLCFLTDTLKKSLNEGSQCLLLNKKSEFMNYRDKKFLLCLNPSACSSS